MDHAEKSAIVGLARQAHGMTEAAYQRDMAVRGGTGWTEKQRILLADMAIHLLMTSLSDGALSADDLKRNLYAILTVSDQFLDEHDLKAVANELYTK